ncbi:MAG TPA: hypothetical protein EYG70_08475 [Sulfurimonas sp.]|nr:hypothetical protein [Sulfurimonas sp.]
MGGVRLFILKFEEKMKNIILTVLFVLSTHLVAETAKYKSCSFSSLENVGMDFLLLTMKDVDNPEKQMYKFLCMNMPNSNFKFLKTDNIKNAPFKMVVNGCEFTINQFIKNRKFYLKPTTSMRKCANNKVKRKNYTFWQNSGKTFKGECSNGRTFSGLKNLEGRYTVSGSNNGNGWGNSKDKAIRDACGF